MTTDGKIAFIREHKSEKSIMKMLLVAISRMETSIKRWADSKDDENVVSAKVDFLKELASFETFIKTLNLGHLDLILIEAYKESFLDKLYKEEVGS